MSKIIAIANLKGGVGKTNVAINLSMFLVALGKKILLIDLSPQSDASFCLGVQKKKNFIEDVLLQKIRPSISIKNTPYFGFDLIPSSSGLRQAKNELDKVRRGELRLKKVLEELEYDFVIIDTAPNFDILMQNALFAADEVIIPVQAEPLAMRSAKDFVSIIDKRKMDIERIRILITMYLWRSLLSRKIFKSAKKDFADKLFNTTIPQAAILAQLPEKKEPILKTVPNSRAARAYNQLAEEVL
jgi:chromosome partitioning protein